jgi:hypothetical protein
MVLQDVTLDNIKRVFDNKGYTLEQNDFKLTFVGIRSKTRLIDNWDDFFAICWTEEGKGKIWTTGDYTTDPGIHYMQKKLLNPLGCGIMAPGYYKGLWREGVHAGKYVAFKQIGQVSIYRDRNLDNYMDMNPETLQSSNSYGANLHHGYASSRVNNNSALCQVLRYPRDLQLALAKYQKHKSLYGELVDYCLLHEEDFVI